MTDEPTKPDEEANETTDLPEEQRSAVPTKPEDFILFAISFLTELAWQRMGLHIDLVKKEIVRDLDQAKLAVDAVGALSELIYSKVDRQTAEALRTSLANLRLNYARQVHSERRST